MKSNWNNSARNTYICKKCVMFAYVSPQIIFVILEIFNALNFDVMYTTQMCAKFETFLLLTFFFKFIFYYIYF